MSNIYNLTIAKLCNKTPFQQSQRSGSMGHTGEIIQHNFLEVATDEHHECNVQAASSSQEMFRLTERKAHLQA